MTGKRPNMTSLLTLALWFALWVAANAQVQMDIYIFGGQSNMQGVAPLQGEPAISNPHSLWMMCGLANGWEPAHDPTNPYPGSGASPALWAGDKLATLSGHQVGIINVATSGTWMWEWTPDYSSHSRYGLITRAYEEACQAGTVRGFFWYQGEADADTAEDVYAYGPRMYQFLNAVHHDLGGVPVVFVQLGPNPNLSGRPYWGSIQLVQKWISEGAPSWLKMVTAKDLSAAGMPTPVHLNQASVITLGGRMGEAMYQLLCEQALN